MHERNSAGHTPPSKRDGPRLANPGTIPVPSRIDDVLRLQRTVGDRAVARMLSRTRPGVVQRNGPPPITKSDLDVLLPSLCIAAYKTFAFHATKSENVASIERTG